MRLVILILLFPFLTLAGFLLLHLHLKVEDILQVVHLPQPLLSLKHDLRVLDLSIVPVFLVLSEVLESNELLVEALHSFVLRLLDALTLLAPMLGRVVGLERTLHLQKLWVRTVIRQRDIFAVQGLSYEGARAELAFLDLVHGPFQTFDPIVVDGLRLLIPYLEKLQLLLFELFVLSPLGFPLGGSAGLDAFPLFLPLHQRQVAPHRRLRQ